MSSPVKTPTEARIAHVVGTLIGIGIAVAGFLASHKGVQIPCTGLTVGTALVTVSHFRYFRVVETTVSSAVTWERENKSVLDTLRANLTPIVSRLLPPGLNGRLNIVEDTAAHALTTAQAQTPVDIEAIAQKVLASLAAATPLPRATTGPVPVKGASTEQAAPAPAASPFLDPPITPQDGAQASV